MTVIAIVSASHCRGDEVVAEVRDRTAAKIVTDEHLAAVAAGASGLEPEKVLRAFSAKTSVFNAFTREKERAAAYLRLALAEALAEDRLIITGFAGLLAPRRISHVLRVCLVAETRFRAALLAREDGLAEKEALKLLHKDDEDARAFVSLALNQKDPWAAGLYDIVLPMDKTEVSAAAALITENAAKPVLAVTESSRAAVKDFLLAAKVEVALCCEGHMVDVFARDGVITLTINKNVLMLQRLTEELKRIVEKVPGVRQVETTVGKDFYKADVYLRINFELPAKVLLVDDEREFVQTLSERLLLRDMGSAVVYDGESALEMVSEEEPEVMILDLKMPGIDGIEVLRRVKKTHPKIEVIILTGHGTEADREVCMKLGAFAYLQKPVDIDQLSATLRAANDKIRRQKEARG